MIAGIESDRPKPAEIKYFISNAPPETALETLVLVAFSRWHVERCFEDQKTESGFDHFEGRKYVGLFRAIQFHFRMKIPSRPFRNPPAMAG